VARYESIPCIKMALSFTSITTKSIKEKKNAEETTTD
jgi:hypothetical protein